MGIHRLNIFDGKEISAFVIDDPGQGQEHEKSTIIIFGSWLASPYGELPIEQLRGSGQSAFAQRGFKEIHIIPRKNHWYQCAEMLEVLDLVRQEIKGKNNWTYGGSMGGYAAINFSQKLNANFIAFCPQFSVNPKVVPFEKRWVADQTSIDFMCDYLWQRVNRFGFVFFDPYSIDLKHAELIKDHTSAVLISCPFAGHNLLKYIQETYGLLNLVLHLVQYEMMPASFRVTQRMKRGSSALYLTQLYMHSLKRKNSRKNQELFKIFLERLRIKLQKLSKETCPKTGS